MRFERSICATYYLLKTESPWINLSLSIFVNWPCEWSNITIKMEHVKTGQDHWNREFSKWNQFSKKNSCRKLKFVTITKKNPLVQNPLTQATQPSLPYFRLGWQKRSAQGWRRCRWRGSRTNYYLRRQEFSPWQKVG